MGVVDFEGPEGDGADEEAVEQDPPPVVVTKLLETHFLALIFVIRANFFSLSPLKFSGGKG